MNMIACSENCIYQKDGYCELETPAAISNNIKDIGCAHFVMRPPQKKQNINAGSVFSGHHSSEP